MLVVKLCYEMGATLNVMTPCMCTYRYSFILLFSLALPASLFLLASLILRVLRGVIMDVLLINR